MWHEQSKCCRYPKNILDDISSVMVLIRIGYTKLLRLVIQELKALPRMKKSPTVTMAIYIVLRL